MGNWYRVVKTIKGHQYLYDQQTYREGGQVRTLNRYIGRAGDVSSSRSGASHAQFDVQRRVGDSGDKLLGRKSQRIRPPAPVTTTPDKRDGEEHVHRMREIKQLTPVEQEKWSNMDHWIRAELSNNEYDSDEELIKSFALDGNMSREEAAAWVSKRGFFLSNIVMDDGTVYDPFRKRAKTRVKDAGKEQNELGRGLPVTTTSSREPPGSAGIGAARPAGVSRDVQAEITSAIIEAIETGRDNGTFQMPWRAIAGGGLPVNAVTHQPYHGINALFLSVVTGKQGWVNEWASFQQWKERGASVRCGEHGTPVVFYSQVQIHVVEEDENGEKHVVTKMIPIFRYSTVFNLSQVDNAPERPAPQTLVDPIETVEKFIAATAADIRYGGNRAYFSPGADYIQIPPRDAFTGSKTSSPTEAFYSTILHELCHWTGGKSRLNRDIHNRFGDETYAGEELVAEIGAAFACAKLSITPELRDDHVQYVASWLKILKEDKRAIFTAAAAASRAVEYLEGLG